MPDVDSGVSDRSAVGRVDDRGAEKQGSSRPAFRDVATEKEYDLFVRFARSGKVKKLERTQALCRVPESEDPAVLESEIRSRLARGERPKEIADALSTTHSKRDVYQLALKLKK